MKDAHRRTTLRSPRINCGVAILNVLLVSTAAAVPTPPAAPGGASENAYGQLAVSITDQMMEGRNLQVRGSLRNPYAESTDGVRLMCQMATDSGDGGRKIEQFQKILTTAIAPGERQSFQFDIQTTLTASGKIGGIRVWAFAIKRGGVEMPRPPDWKDQ
jgi:hypothetical protein